MLRRLDLEQILAGNPQIDPEQLEEAREMHRRLRERGIRRKDYDLASPFGGHRASVQEDTGADDPRLVRLRRWEDKE